MDPITLRSYIDNARYQLEQAAQRRISYEQEAQKYQDQATDYDYQAQKYRKYAEDSMAQAASYATTEDQARRDLEYYTARAIEADQQAAQAALY